MPPSVKPPSWKRDTPTERTGKTIFAVIVVILCTLAGSFLAGFGMYMFSGRINNAMINDTTGKLIARLIVGAVVGAIGGLIYAIKMLRS